MDANKLENIISGYGINADDAAWLRALPRLTPDRERVAGAIGGAIKDHFSDKPWTEVRLIAADAAIAAMGEP